MLVRRLGLQAAATAFVDASGLPFATMFGDKSVLGENHPGYLTADTLYPRWAGFFRPNDVIVTDTGTSWLGLAFAQSPYGAEFHNPTLWASIGWATPAAFGAAIGAPDRRLILITGEGAHQMTAQEIGQFGRHGLRPIIFVLNNSGYLSERMLCKDMAMAYNDVAEWKYAELPPILGCHGWFTAQVTTCGELDDALRTVEQADGAADIEVVTDAYEAPPL